MTMSWEHLSIPDVLSDEGQRGRMLDSQPSAQCSCSYSFKPPPPGGFDGHWVVMLVDRTIRMRTAPIIANLMTLVD